MKNIFYADLVFPRPQSGTTSARRETDFTKFSNLDLKFTLDILSLHQSPYEVHCANEIERRIEAGTWINFDDATPPLTNDVPKWLKMWPFSLLWEQSRL